MMEEKELKEKIEFLREKMHSASDKEKRLKISQKLDKLIVKHLKLQMD